MSANPSLAVQRVMRNARPTLRLLGTGLSSDCTVPALPIAPEGLAVEVVAATPVALTQSFLLQQGERLVAWMCQHMPSSIVCQAWVAVRQTLAQDCARILQMIKGHPYVSISASAVVVACLWGLIRRHMVNFAQATEETVDRVMQLEWKPPSASEINAIDLQRPPEHFKCPITFEIMIDPCITPSGHTYERRALESWISINGTDPQTRAPLSISQVIPNRALKDCIQQWRAQSPTCSPVE